MKKLNDFNFKGKIAIIRVDFNVPLDENLRITDSTRIDLGIKSIDHVISNGGKCIIMSHLGRPKGNGYEKDYSLKNILKYLSRKLNKDVLLIDQYFKDDFSIGGFLNERDVVLLENLRFYSEEKENDLNFAKKLASMADIYVNNAFGTCHRAHASTNSIIKFSKNYCIGDLVNDELNNINKVLFDENKPFTAILGGAKVSDKINVIEKLIDLVDNIIIGGAMANTFIKSKGGNIGKSLFEEDNISVANSLIRKAEKQNVKIYLPEDLVCSKSIDDFNTKIFNSYDLPDEYSGFDVGYKSINTFKEVIKRSKKIIWNGPMGVFEIDAFSKGTFEICNSVTEATKKGAFSLVGGGDSVSAVKKNNKENNISFISTGGGALLEYISNGTLPSLELLNN
ncbi:MAG: phosphoglycerate kinase [Flammeovirgaceae bacterium]|nr:phosphoglycerate kinase [Flammeovirgaceae bacterium]